jgi:hypothetical protein
MEANYEDDIRPFVSDDDNTPNDKHHLNPDIIKYAKEILPRPQLFKSIFIQTEPLPPMPIPSKLSEISPANEFLKQLYVPSTYNNDISNTKRGLDILKAIKTTNKDLLPEVMETYKLDFDTQIDLSGNTLTHICAAYNRADLIKHIQANGGSVTYKNILGEQPLHIAAREGSFEVINHILTDSSININTTTNVYQTLTLGWNYSCILFFHKLLEQTNRTLSIQQRSRH